MTETQIREDNVLEIRALVMTRKVFDQLREITPQEAGLLKDPVVESNVIGWASVDIGEWYIVKHPAGGIAKMTSLDMTPFIEHRLGGEDAVLKITRPADPVARQDAPRMRDLIHVYRDSLRQIFVK